MLLQREANSLAHDQVIVDEQHANFFLPRHGVHAGTCNSTRVPFPRCDWISTEPFTCDARSRMLINPQCAPPFLSSEMPRPLSTTRNTTPRRLGVSSIFTSDARACFSTFINASCVMR